MKKANMLYMLVGSKMHVGGAFERPSPVSIRTGVVVVALG
jgi:hypothetical protein